MDRDVMGGSGISLFGTVSGLLPFAWLLWFAGLLLIVSLIGIADGEITVDQAGEGDYRTIQEAIDNATEGETIQVFAGTYQENLVVNRSMSIIGAGADAVVIEGDGTNTTILVVADRVNISGIRITGGGGGVEDAGLRIEGSNISVTDSIVSGNGNHGIIGTLCQDLTITGTECSGQFRIGILLQNVEGAIISRNTISDNGRYGLLIDTAVDLTLRDNVVNNNTLQGASIHRTTTSDFINNSCAGNHDGLMLLDGSNNNRIRGNNCSSNTHTGISLWEASNNNIIEENTCDLNTIYSGIYLANDCSNNTINNNTCSWNGFCGFYAYNGCSDNTITNNTFSSSQYAVYLNTSCTGNEVHWNQFEGNAYGVIADESSPVNAENNFWGHNSGPRNAERNPNGIGSPASNEVDFDPWLTRSDDPPEAFITSIFPNPCEQGATIQFTARGEDNGAIVRYVWTSSNEGELYNGPLPTFDYFEFSLGDHTITLIVEDDIGLLSPPVTATLTVYEGTGANERPEVTITSHRENQTVDGRTTLSGTATDANGDETIAWVRIRIAGGEWFSAEYDNMTTEWTATWYTTQWKNGEQLVEVRAFDGLRFSEVAEMTLVVENEDDEDAWCGLILIVIALAFTLFFLLGWKFGYVAKMLQLIHGQGT